LLAHHRQELRALLRKFLGVFGALAPIALDSQPVHRLAREEALLADDRQIVFRIAGRRTGVAARAGIEIDDHGPLVRSILVLIRLRALDPQFRPVGVRLSNDKWRLLGKIDLIGRQRRDQLPALLKIRRSFVLGEALVLIGLGDRDARRVEREFAGLLVEDRIEDLQRIGADVGRIAAVATCP
jgi:hypothetical protein